MNQIINMVIRVIMRKALNSGISAGIGAFANRGKGRSDPDEPVSKQDRADQKRVQANANGARKMAKVTRRITRM